MIRRAQAYSLARIARPIGMTMKSRTGQDRHRDADQQHSDPDDGINNLPNDGHPVQTELCIEPLLARRVSDSANGWRR